MLENVRPRLGLNCNFLNKLSDQLASLNNHTIIRAYLFSRKLKSLSDRGYISESYKDRGMAVMSKNAGTRGATYMVSKFSKIGP